MILHRTGGTILLLLVANAVPAEEPLPAGARMKFLVPGAAPGNRPWCVAFSPDGKTLAVGASDKQIHLFDVATGRHLRCFGSHLDYVWTVAFSPDGKWIASGGRADFPVRIWNLEGEEQKPCDGEHHGGITKIKFFKDGKKLIMSGGSWDPTVRVWDFPNRKQLVEMKGHTDYIDAMDLASNERVAVTASRDGTWRLWDVRTGRQIRSHHAEQHGYASVAFSPDGHWFVTCDSVGIFQIWETASGLPRQAGSQDGSRNTVVTVSPDGRLTTCGWGGRRELQIRITDTGELLYLMVGKNDGVRSICYSPDSRLLASCDDAGAAYVWDVDLTSHTDRSILTNHQRLESWNGLTTPDAKLGFVTILRLACDSGPVEEFLDRRLKPAAEGDSKQISRWVESLGSKSFSERDEATRQLAAAGEAATVALVAAWNSELSPEARSRVRRLLERLDAVPPPETLQTLRAFEVLERRGKPEAIPILKRLAAGASGFAVTIDAQETLERMEKRK